MEYIGFKDAADKEIYEGDILKFPDDNMLLVVRFDNDSLSFVLDEYGYKGCLMEYGFDEDAGKFGVVDTYSFSDFNNCNSLIIVGNIYENPELIKP